VNGGLDMGVRTLDDSPDDDHVKQGTPVAGSRT
jgi:hypothetical protein